MSNDTKPIKLLLIFLCFLNFSVSKFQIGFINFICLPVYEALEKIAPEASVVTNRVKENKQKWQDLYDGKIEPPIDLPKMNKYGIYEFAEQ